MNNNISDIYSAISIILVFIMVIYDIEIKKMNEIMDERKPPEEQKEKLKNFKRKVKKCEFRLLFVGITLFLLFWILFPKAVEIISTSHINLINFDIANTLYVFIEIAVFFMFITIIINFIKISKK